jgi:hypothetical protein
VQFGRKDQRGNRTFKKTAVWMRSEDPALIWQGGLRELHYVYGSLRVISASRPRNGEHPLAGHDLSYEERCAVGAVDAFQWLVDRGHHRREAARLVRKAQTLADALAAKDFDTIVETCNLIATDLEALGVPI